MLVLVLVKRHGDASDPSPCPRPCSCQYHCRVSGIPVGTRIWHGSDTHTRSLQRHQHRQRHRKPHPNQHRQQCWVCVADSVTASRLCECEIRPPMRGGGYSGRGGCVRGQAGCCCYLLLLLLLLLLVVVVLRVGRRLRYVQSPSHWRMHSPLPGAGVAESATRVQAHAHGRN